MSKPKIENEILEHLDAIMRIVGYIEDLKDHIEVAYVAHLASYVIEIKKLIWCIERLLKTT